MSRCLTPRGVSGLKYFDWLNVQRLRSLTPRGVSGLKSPPCRMSLRRSTRLTPRGVSGLKFGIGSVFAAHDGAVSPREG